MAIRNIVKDGDPILRKKSRLVTDFDSKLSRILDDMLETMKRADGVGLAAPQIGFLRRFAICELKNNELLEIVNPEILEKSGEQIGPEGCLSCPKRSEDVLRPKRIKLKYQDRYGNEHIRELEDFDAVVVSHETDHLNGILFYDKAVTK